MRLNQNQLEDSRASSHLAQPPAAQLVAGQGRGFNGGHLAFAHIAGQDSRQVGVGLHQGEEVGAQVLQHTYKSSEALGLLMQGWLSARI